MGSKAIFNLCLKVVGVYYALKALNMLPATITQSVLTWNAWRYTDRDGAMGMMLNYKLASVLSVIIPLLLFILALLIILNSEKIVNLLIKKDASTDKDTSSHLAVIALDLSIKIFGVFSLFSSVPYFSKLLSRYWIMKENLRLYDNTGKIELASSGTTAVVYLVAGFLLLFYSDPLSKKITKFGPTALKNSEAENEPS